MIELNLIFSFLLAYVILYVSAVPLHLTAVGTWSMLKNALFGKTENFKKPHDFAGQSASGWLDFILVTLGFLLDIPMPKVEYYMENL